MNKLSISEQEKTSEIQRIAQEEEIPFKEAIVRYYEKEWGDFIP